MVIRLQGLTIPALEKAQKLKFPDKISKNKGQCGPLIRPDILYCQVFNYIHKKELTVCTFSIVLRKKSTRYMVVIIEIKLFTR